MLKTMRILLLVALAACVRGAPVLPKLYLAEEGHDLTIWWDDPSGTNLSLASITCIQQSEPQKYTFKMAFGSLFPKFAHPHFAGRVEVDRDALQRGKMWLHLSRIVADDEGNYQCHLVAGYVSGTWLLQANEYFAIAVMGPGDATRATPLTRPPMPTDQGRKEVELQRMSLAVTVLGVMLGAFIMIIGVLLMVHATVGHYQT